MMKSCEYCPLCCSEIRLVQINFTEAIRICSNAKCIHPLERPGASLEIVKRDYMKNFKEQTEPRSGSEVYTSTCEYLPNDGHDYLDDFFSNCPSIEMSEDDIQNVDSLFEALQNYKS